MKNRKKILVVKHGALGDVVRTSFFAKSLRSHKIRNNEDIELFWLTSTESSPLLRFNPYIDHIITDSSKLLETSFDVIYSLDDEDDVLLSVNSLITRSIVGASIDPLSLKKSYCEQSANWFDMGLLSKHGKSYADQLKLSNTTSHSEIFKKLFNVECVDFSFYNSEFIENKAKSIVEKCADGKIPIALNAFAGKRWMNKSLPECEIGKMIHSLANLTVKGNGCHLFLLGSGEDLERYQIYIKKIGILHNLTAINTDSSILEFAAVVRQMKLVVTTDSLCLHLSIGQQVPTVAFFAPTSAAEIENLPYVRKVISLAKDYCSYRPEADNSSITAERIMVEVCDLANSILISKTN